MPSGLLDISECYYGFPIALSYPHFLDTNESVAQQVEGMKPNRSAHETYFYIQPVSASALFTCASFKRRGEHAEALSSKIVAVPSSTHISYFKFIASSYLIGCD